MSERSKILIVDDSNTFILYLKSLLEDEKNIELRAIQDPRQAVAEATSWQPDLLLTDFEMPDIGGPELCRIFRRNEELKDIFIIMLTSKEGDMPLVEAINNGANDYICKASHKAVILIKIQSMIRQAEMAKALINRKQLEAISMLIVTAKHNLNNSLAISNMAIRNAQKNNITPEAALEQVREINMDISLTLNKLDEIENLESELYAGRTKMLKLSK